MCNKFTYNYCTNANVDVALKQMTSWITKSIFNKFYLFLCNCPGSNKQWSLKFWHKTFEIPFTQIQDLQLNSQTLYIGLLRLLKWNIEFKLEKVQDLPLLRENLDHRITWILSKYPSMQLPKCIQHVLYKQVITPVVICQYSCNNPIFRKFNTKQSKIWKKTIFVTFQEVDLK